MSHSKNEQAQESAQTTKGAYQNVRDRGVRKLDERLRSLEDETSVAEGEEAVPLLHRHPIDLEHLFPRTERGDEH